MKNAINVFNLLYNYFSFLLSDKVSGIYKFMTK